MLVYINTILSIYIEKVSELPLPYLDQKHPKSDGSQIEIIRIQLNIEVNCK